MELGAYLAENIFSPFKRSSMYCFNSLKDIPWVSLLILSRASRIIFTASNVFSLFLVFIMTFILTNLKLSCFGEMGVG